MSLGHSTIGEAPLGALAGGASHPVARIAAPGPLGSALVLAEMQLIAAIISAPGPLGSGAVLGSVVAAARMAATGPLGSALVLASQPVFGHASATGPLGATAILARHDFSAALGDTITRFVMDLVTPGGTVRVPISSWQATLQSGSSCYVQCVVPACLNYAGDINTATEFVIYRRADVPGTALAIEYEMARSPVGQAQFDQGPQRYTCTLSGYPNAFAEDLNPPVVYDRALAGVRSISSGGSLRVRCAVDWLLRPGHRAYVGATPMVVRYINYYANSTDGYMDVGE